MKQPAALIAAGCSIFKYRLIPMGFHSIRLKRDPVGRTFLDNMFALIEHPLKVEPIVLITGATLNILRNNVVKPIENRLLDRLQALLIVRALALGILFRGSGLHIISECHLFIREGIVQWMARAAKSGWP